MTTDLTPVPQARAPSDYPPSCVEQTTCCIVGGGPAGAMLALMLARRGVAVTLLEAQYDFERPFRGNTINPAALTVLQEIGMAEAVLQLRHARVDRFVVDMPRGALTFADFRRLNVRHPFVMMMPQSSFLTCITDAARRYPHFRLEMGANVRDLIIEDGSVRGVRYQTRDNTHELRATLTVGADGRFSRVRRLVGMQPIATAPPMDVLWFNLPRIPADDDGIGGIFRFGPRCLLVLIDHFDHWQVGYIIAKGAFTRLRAQGLDAFREALVALIPNFAARLDTLQSWKQTSLLSVESNRLARWYQPGLLLIGDAAHVTSPVGGVGINLAIQDAVVAANVLATPLLAGSVTPRHLAAVQRQREWPTRIIQGFQNFAQRQVIANALDAAEPYQVPLRFQLMLRTPLLRDLPAWLIGFGAWPVHVVQ